MRAALLTACLVCFLAAAAGAQPPRVALGGLDCVPREGHAVVRVDGAGLPAGAELRVYFRRQAFGDFYWVPVHASGSSAWAVLPLPEPDNHAAEVYAAVYAGGRPLAQSAVRTVPVTADCEAALEAAQAAHAADLTVGESNLGQKFRKLAWWRCQGVSERIDVHGERRDDESCAPVALWWERPEMLVPFALVWGGGVTTVVIDEEPPRELSPANP